jgi:hypothetical protein
MQWDVFHGKEEDAKRAKEKEADPPGESIRSCLY